MRKIFILAIFIIATCVINDFAQSISKSDVQKNEIEIEQFMGMLDGIYPDNLIDNMSYLLPSELKILNYSIGEFSDLGYYDLAIAYKDASCSYNTLKIILLVNIDNKSFKKVLEAEAEWRDNPFDVGFSISKNTISLTHRRNKMWLFSSYCYNNERLKLLREEMY